MKLGKVPPSPCKVCSSPRHWNHECPYWDQYLEKMRKRTAQIAALQINRDTNPEEAYHTTYQVLTTEQQVTSGLGSEGEVSEGKSDFHEGSQNDQMAEQAQVVESKSTSSTISHKSKEESLK